MVGPFLNNGLASWNAQMLMPDGSPFGLTSGMRIEAWFRQYNGGPILVSISTDAGITIVDASNLNLVVSTTAMGQLPGGTYVYDVLIIGPGGENRPLFQDTLVVLEGSTERPVDTA